MKDEKLNEVELIINFFSSVLETKRIKKIKTQEGLEKKYQIAISELSDYINKGRLK